jgi:hypothetical protein
MLVSFRMYRELGLFRISWLDPGSHHVSKAVILPRNFWKLLLTKPLTGPGARPSGPPGFQEDQFLILLAIPARSSVVGPPPTVDSMRIGLRFLEEEVAGLDEGWLRGDSSDEPPSLYFAYSAQSCSLQP